MMDGTFQDTKKYRLAHHPSIVLSEQDIENYRKLLVAKIGFPVELLETFTHSLMPVDGIYFIEEKAFDLDFFRNNPFHSFSKSFQFSTLSNL